MRDGRVSSDEFNKEGRAIWSSFKRAVIPDRASPRSHKCSYCERIRDRRELDVEHWRPKAMVEEWAHDDWTTVSYVPASEHRKDGKPSTHPGYWWVAYDWNNYAIACKDCNEHWKGNYFPVESKRASCDEDLSVETPLLLDPYSGFESDDVFCWDRKGIVHPTNNRARATILVFGLNRPTLVTARQKHLLHFLPMLEDMPEYLRLGRLDKLKALIACIRSWGGDDDEFAAMIRWFVWDALGRRADAHWKQLFAG